METDFHRDVKLLRDLVNDLDRSASEITEGTLESDIVAALLLEQCRSDLLRISGELQNRLVPLMPRRNQEEDLGTRTVVIEGVGTVEGHAKSNRKSWDKETLLRDVLDSRVFDSDGTDRYSTPLEKVLHVWNLGAPRTTALKELGLDPDDYCTSEWAGYSLKVA